jgi:hypothetical protein
MHVKQNLDVRLQFAPLIRGANAHSHLSQFSIEEEKVRKCKLLRMLCITACTFATQHAALAQTAWPSRPIRLVVPFAPPSSTDDIARMLATKLTARLNQPVIVENKPGAGGTLGTNFVAKAPPDEYTVLFISTSVVTAAASGKKLPFDPVKDLEPIGELAGALQQADQGRQHTDGVSVIKPETEETTK